MLQAVAAAVGAVLVAGSGADARTVTAVFNDDNTASATVRGTVRFTQATASDPVEIDVDLTGLRYGGANGNGWHVHKFPVTDSDCSDASVSGHYNPPAMCVETASLPESFDDESVEEDRNRCAGITSLGTPDACMGVYTSSPADSPDARACSYAPAANQAGELSDNVGLLDGDVEEGAEQICDGSSCFTPRAYRATHTDDHITLFGPHSIVGRSIVIHRNDGNNDRFACATIGQMRVATATFDESSSVASTVRGHVMFSGVQGGPTVVDIELTGLQDTPNPWCATSAALIPPSAETGGHFNPPTAPGQGELSIQIGDLSAPTVTRQGETDQISLWGDADTTIVGKSIVLHRNNNLRYACANIDWSWDEAPAKVSAAIRPTEDIAALTVVLLAALTLAH